MARFALPLLLLVLAHPSSPALAGDAAKDAKEAEEQALKKMRDESPTVRLDGVKQAWLLEGATLTSQLVRLLADPDADVRTATIEALRTRSDKAERKKAAQALAARLAPLAKEADRGDEYRRVIAALHDLAEPAAISALAEFAVEEPEETARLRLMAIGNTPAPEAIETLINVMSKGRNRGRNNQRNLAVQALRYATGENFGEDPDRWRSWWREAKDTFDFKAQTDRRAEEARAAEEKARRRAEAEEKRKERQGKKDGEGDGDGKGGDGKEGDGGGRNRGTGDGRPDDS